MQVLIRFEFDESAEKISVEANEFFQLIESSKFEIWDKSAPTSLANIVSNQYKTYSNDF